MSLLGLLAAATERAIVAGLPRRSGPLRLLGPLRSGQPRGAP